jgi:hypothetical protein
MPDSSLKDILSGPFSFSVRPKPIAGDLRMSWGISVLLLSLFYCRGKKGSFQKIQFLAHAVRIPEGREDVRSLLQGRLRPSDISVRVEPWLNRAVSYAYALKLVTVDKGKAVTLTAKGVDVAGAITKSKDVFLQEQTFLREIAPKITEVLLTKIWRMEDLI